MTNLELQRYNDFLFLVNTLSYKREISQIYRGDSLENLCKKLNIDYLEENTDTDLVSERLFMVGEKAKRYYIDDNSFRIEEYENKVFGKIIKYFNDSLKNKNENIKYFFERNSVLRDFFTDKKNKQIFQEKIREASKLEKLAIRDYYLTLLHQLAAINYKNKSHFVSASKDYKIAREFSSSRKEKYRVILHCWQPIKNEKSIVKKFSLPTYSFHPFQYQKEYSLLGGILPHFIHVIEFCDQNKFVPNPNIFNQDITKYSLYYGLEIDQSEFFEVLEHTNYKRSMTTNGTVYWENSNS
ncbi:hypothetical protein M2347_003932 [Chryseobacterium sp. H1D6B]|uniref:hypothetical protein n=1 Tax=Chryseobacterium sp. H1D6B TaxID=2940588 RepID=UPI0015CB5FCE|nr:hypothetical protein [Chryseobacterium sp. H1D6B]MDH6254205.1 hypothetical protein [Chryseobacterium sp. H1D6B]